MTYRPILKAKAGEIDALKSLDETKELIPLLELPPIPLKYEGTEPSPSRTINAHSKALSKAVADCAGSLKGVMIDGFFLEDEETLDDGRECFEHICEAILANDVGVVPVTGLDRVEEYQEAVASVANKSGHGICIRVTRVDFDDTEDIEESVLAISSEFGIDPSNVDVLLDYGPIEAGTVGLIKTAAIQLINSLTEQAPWRSITVGAGAFPRDLSGIAPNTLARIDRLDWTLWNSIRASDKLRCKVDYCDYCIAHPELSEIDPRIMRMSPNIRYASNAIWVVAKGEAYRRKKDKKQSIPGKVQYPILAKNLIDDQAWSGAEFSWGDAFIKGCADGECGPGNATTWRSVGTSHHIAFVLQQLANLL